jgi:hypothetical protein
MFTVSTSNTSKQLLCCYVNQTKRIQIVKIDSIDGCYLQRVIFPSERFLFEAPAEATLEIYIQLAGQTILLDSIPCSHLQTQTTPKKTLEFVN